VIEHDVAKEKENAFREWQTQITEAASRYEGYLGTDVCPPVEADQNRWYIMVHFDSSENLSHWLDSDVRQALIERGKTIFSSTKITYYKTGLERWFLYRKTNPPAWKQIMATLLGLYPTVMILLLLQSSLEFMNRLSQADAMLISNLLSCCLLTLFVMPFVARLLKFWLQPAHQTSPQNNWIGLLLILAALGFMRSFFVWQG